MEQEKNNKGVIALLIVVIVILLALVVLLATGTISFKGELSNNNKHLNESSQQNSGENSLSENTETSENVNNTDQTDTLDWYTIELNNNGVDGATLNKLLDIVGISNDKTKGNYTCLNYYLSNNDYNQYAKEIITRYARSHNYFKFDIDDIDVLTCRYASDCAMIKKSDAEKIIKLYNFSGNVDDYFEKINDDNYSKEWFQYSPYHDTHGPCLNVLNIIHKLTSEYTTDNNIKIIDNMIITHDDNGEKTINKTVEYNFKTDENGNYYLNNVVVK